MPNLKDLKNRIESVKSTRKITKAMQMVAAAKLRKAQEAAEQARPYAEKMSIVIEKLAFSTNASSNSPLLVGNGKDKTHLIIVATSERGLCGAFNSSIVRLAKNHINHLISSGNNDDGVSDWEAIPEFGTLLMPIASVLLIIGYNYRKKETED